MDIPRMSAEQLAQNVAEPEENAPAVDMGGIYTWYQSEVLYHHINEWLPKERDLLGDTVRERRKRRVKMIARFDSGKVNDSVYLQKP